MNQKNNLDKNDDYNDFFQKLPVPDLNIDYLEDIEIQDESESPRAATGLTVEQVSQLADDSLEKPNLPKGNAAPPEK